MQVLQQLQQLPVAAIAYLLVHKMAGRRRKSNVWNYFKFEQDYNKSTCQVQVVKNGEEKICGAELTGTFLLVLLHKFFVFSDVFFKLEAYICL